MYTAEQIKNTTFDRSMRGYRTEDVAEFLEGVADQLDANEKEKREMEEKLYALAEKIQEYKKDEDALKTALINAQRLGESVIHEARVKADTIIRDASAKAERIIEAADARNEREQLALARLKEEVTKFKGDVLNLYKQHIDLLSALPVEEEMQEATADPQGEATDIMLILNDTDEASAQRNFESEERKEINKFSWFETSEDNPPSEDELHISVFTTFEQENSDDEEF